MASHILVAMVAFAATAAFAMPDSHPAPPEAAAAVAMAAKQMMEMQMQFKKMLMMSMKEGMEWYPAEQGDRCNRVPRDVGKGMPLMEGCQDGTEGVEQCVCMKKPPALIEMMETMGMDTSLVNRRTGYANVCGECVNPCALKWKPVLPDMDGNPIMTDMDMLPDTLNDLVGPMSDDLDISEVPRTVRAMLNVAMDILDKKQPMMDKKMMEEGDMMEGSEEEEE